jgi:hypothetical protein
MSQAAGRALGGRRAGAAESAEPADAGIDPRITYPCYKSFDEFIDVDRLRSLDGYVTERVRRHAAALSGIRFYTGPHRLKDTDSDRPGSRMIYLAQSSRPDSYYDLDRTELWHPTEACEEFSELMRFIRTLPFAATGRMLIMYDDTGAHVPAHRDHDAIEVCHEFVWFRTNLLKPFYMLDRETGERRYVESYSAWFDSVNQFHGGDAADGLSFSIRVDGRFTDEFRELIPRPSTNAASAPALWASLAGAAAAST